MNKNSFMNVIKNNKIAVLVSEPGCGTINFLKETFRNKHPELNVRFINNIMYQNDVELRIILEGLPFVTKKPIVQNDIDILVIDTIVNVNNQSEDETPWKYLESLSENMNIILYVHHIPTYMKKNDRYIIYPMYSNQDKQNAYEGSVVSNKSEQIDNIDRTIYIRTNESKECIAEKIKEKATLPYGTMFISVIDTDDVYTLLDFFRTKNDCFDLWFDNALICDHVTSDMIAQTLYKRNQTDRKD